MRGLWLASRNEDPFCRFAAAGLTMMFGVQSWINMAVNLRAMPAKGMTLPFISYGGSSLLALGLGMGFLIALTRRRPLGDLHAKPDARGMSEPRCILARGGRHRRPSVSRRRRWRPRWRGAASPVELATDERALKYGGEFPARAIHAIPSATPTGAGVAQRRRARRWCSGAALVAALALVATAAARSRSSALAAIRPCRRCSPPRCCGAPTVLHEQNAVMGRANRFLAARVDAHRHRLSRPEGRAAPPCAPRRATPAIRCARRCIAAAATPYPDFADGRLRLLVTGGSQGARVMSDVVPAALALLSRRGARAHPPDHAGARRGQGARRRRLRAMDFPVELAEFFADLPGAHRRGASRHRPRRRLDRLANSR